MQVSLAAMALPQTKRALKRSASTASLPTPPRTHSRRGRGRSRGSCDSDSDEHAEAGNVESALLSTDEEDNELPQPHQSDRKKRRLSKNENDDDEEAFWAARPDSEPGVDRDQTSAPDRESSSSAPLLYRKSLQRSRSQSTNGLASPPPSHRKRQAQAPSAPLLGTPESSLVVLPKSNPTSPPATPKKQIGLASRAKTKGAKIPQFPIISDSPDNPFYDVPVSPSPGEDSESPRVSTSPKTPGTSNYHEKPTVTYVFRGVRREYQNPLYNHAKNRPLSPPPNSLLPIEHPDYSPDMTCKPTVLFPTARKGKRAAVRADTTAAGPLRRSPRRQRHIVGDSEDEDDHLSGLEERAEAEEGEAIRPRKLDFGPPKNAGKTKRVPRLGGDGAL